MAASTTRRPAGRARACGRCRARAPCSITRAARRTARRSTTCSCGPTRSRNRPGLKNELQVMSSLAIREAYLELVPRFEKDSGRKVATVWAGMVDIKKRLLAGDLVDLVIGSAAAVDELIAPGKVTPGSRVHLAQSSLAGAVRAGARP